MRVTERLIRDTQKQNERRRISRDEAEEETYTYQNRVKSPSLQENPGVFTRKKLEGINTRGSVFDETAVFHTRKTGER